MANYRVKITPLEPYTFGTEQGSVYQEVKRFGNKEGYLMTSNYLPDQTTVFGTMRYLILKEKGLLHSDFKYSKDDQQGLTDAIGSASFSFGVEKQEFGLIESISPMFLLDKELNIVIKNPYCNTAKDDYCSMEMNKPIKTSYGEIATPVYGEQGYKAKNGYGSGFISLSNKKTYTYEDIFKKNLISGNYTSSEGKKDEDGFFKREVISILNGFSFGVFVSLKEEVFNDGEKIIAYMGRKNSAFEFAFEQVNDDFSLSEKVEETFKNEKDTWFYALSDIYCAEDITYKQFAIVDTKKLRNIETIYEGRSYSSKRKKNALIYLIQAGSVFYQESPMLENAHCQMAGYNYIVRLGGQQNA